MNTEKASHMPSQPTDNICRNGQHLILYWNLARQRQHLPLQVLASAPTRRKRHSLDCLSITIRSTPYDCLFHLYILAPSTAPIVTTTSALNNICSIQLKQKSTLYNNYSL